MAKRSKTKRKPAEGSPASRRDWLWGLALVAAVIVAYLPVWRAGFVWDDEEVVTSNPCVVGPLGLKEIWTTRAADICPMTLTTFWAEHKLWGLAPLPYHLVNVLMQGGCAVVLWRVLLGLKIPGAWFGAALWALHPVQVESVAWVTEMKNTESGLFYLLSIFFFIRSFHRRGRDYGLCLLFAALAMTSKSSTVVLPLILLLCAWWLAGRWNWRDAVRVGPVFLMSIATGLVSIWTQKLSGAGNPQWALSWPQRLITAGEAAWFYLGKLVWPYPLVLIYPRWQIDAGRWFLYLPALAVLIVPAVLWSRRGSWARPWLFAWGYFLVALLPVLGFIQMTYQWHSLVADHFQYLASMGPLALAGAGAVRLARDAGSAKAALPFLGAGLLLVLGIVSWERSTVYVSEEALWTDTLAKNPKAWAAHNNLGRVLVDRGQVDEAMAHVRKALEVNPESAESYNILGIALTKKGAIDDALGQFHRTLKIDPGYAEAYNNIGVALAQVGKTDQAIAAYQKALELNPSYIVTDNDLGAALAGEGKTDAAIAQFQKALALNPDYAEAHNNLGNAYFQQRRLDEATVQYQKAIAAKPDYANAHDSLGMIFLNTRHPDPAAKEFEQAVSYDAGNGGFRNNLGIAYAQMGRIQDAYLQFKEAVRLQPDSVGAQKNLARAAAQLPPGTAK